MSKIRRSNMPPCPCGEQHWAKGMCHKHYEQHRYNERKKGEVRRLIYLDKDTDASVSEWAKKHYCTIGETILTFVTWGLERSNGH